MPLLLLALVAAIAFAAIGILLATASIVERRAGRAGSRQSGTKN